MLIDGLAGKWIYVGADLGRGWVFDGFVSPVPVFQVHTSLRDYVLMTLGYTLEDKISDVSLDKSNHQLKIYARGGKGKFIEHYYNEADEDELQIFGLTEGQAKESVKNFIRAVGLKSPLKTQETWPGVISFEHELPALEDGSTYEFLYSEGTLYLRRKGWFIRSMD